MVAKGYSLWLMPVGETYDRFSGLIRKLAGAYNAPLFEPHITVLGEVTQTEEEALKKSEELVAGQKSFAITFQNVEYEDFYFRALFVKVKITEPLLFLHNRAKEIFNMREVPFYMPHISILYGDFSPSVKESIIAEIGRNMVFQFVVSSIHLFKTDGEVKTWQRVREIPFS